MELKSDNLNLTNKQVELTPQEDYLLNNLIFSGYPKNRASSTGWLYFIHGCITAFLLANARSVDKQKKIALSVADKIEKLIISRILKEFDDLLTPYGFLRVHQSHLINLDEIKSFIKTDGGYIRMKDGSSVSISRQRRNYVMEILKQL